MPPRKSKQFVGVLRGEILSGQRTPGAKLPTYSALGAQFGVARPTISRGVKAMVSEGLVTVDPRRGMFVAMKLPHHSRYLWVSSERPGGTGWTSLSATILELIERGETGIAGDLVPLVGVDGRTNNPAYQSLCDAVERRSAAGLLLMGSTTIGLLPIMQTPGLPRVAVGVAAPHAALLGLDFGQLIERASQWLRIQAGGIAVFSPHAPDLERAQDSLLRRGLDEALLSTLHVGPVGFEKVAELLFERTDRPQAVFVMDDSLVPPLLSGFARARVRIGRDVRVLAHCNWPRALGADQGIQHIGFDAREILAAAKENVDAQRDGKPSRGRVVPPRFADEVLPALTLELGPVTSAPPSDVITLRRSI
jgi:hypothetical protein